MHHASVIGCLSCVWRDVQRAIQSSQRVRSALGPYLPHTNMGEQKSALVSLMRSCEQRFEVKFEAFRSGHTSANLSALVSFMRRSWAMRTLGHTKAGPCQTLSPIRKSGHAELAKHEKLADSRCDMGRESVLPIQIILII